MTGRSQPSTSGDVAAFLDIGTAKTACLIVAKGEGDALPTVLGAGVRATRGLKAGVVVEMDGVEQAIRGAVSDAEAAARLSLSQVSLAIACGRLRAQTFAAEAQVARHVVTGKDIDRVLQAGAAFAQRDGRLLLDLSAIVFRIDGAPCDTDPSGVPGHMLGADLVAVTADEAPLVNLVHVIGRADLETGVWIASPYASGLAATTEHDRQASVLCIDFGGGTTQLALFARGHLLLCDVIPVGGNHITFDIARALGVPLPEAERIKKLYGTVSASASELKEVFTYSSRPPADHEGDSSSGRSSMGGTNSMSRGDLQSLIDVRMTSLFAHIAERLERSGLAQYAHRLIVVTGGTSQLSGLHQAAAAYFRRPVQQGLVPQLPGLPAELSGPHMAAVVGMAIAPPGYHVRMSGSASAEERQGYLQRVGRWLRGS